MRPPCLSHSLPPHPVPALDKTPVAFLFFPSSVPLYPPGIPPAHQMKTGSLRDWLLGRRLGEGLTASWGNGGCPPRLYPAFKLRFGLRAGGRGSRGLPLAGPDPLSQSRQG